MHLNTTFHCFLNSEIQLQMEKSHPQEACSACADWTNRQWEKECSHFQQQLLLCCPSITVTSGYTTASPSSLSFCVSVENDTLSVFSKASPLPFRHRQNCQFLLLWCHPLWPSWKDGRPAAAEWTVSNTMQPCVLNTVTDTNWGTVAQPCVPKHCDWHKKEDSCTTLCPQHCAWRKLRDSRSTLCPSLITVIGTQTGGTVVQPCVPHHCDWGIH